MSLRKSGSEAKIIDHRTDKDYGDYVPEIKSKQEDKTFQDMLSVFVDCHPEIKSNWESGKVHDKTFECIFSRPVPPSEEFGYKLKMDETRSPSQDVLSKWKSGTVNDMTCLGIFPVPGQKPRHCGACGGEHDFYFCPLRWTCEFDQKVGEDYEVVCHCSKLRCSGPCPSLVGRVRMKKMVSNFDVLDPAQFPRFTRVPNEEDG